MRLIPAASGVLSATGGGNFRQVIPHPFLFMSEIKFSTTRLPSGKQWDVFPLFIEENWVSAPFFPRLYFSQRPSAEMRPCDLFFPLVSEHGCFSPRIPDPSRPPFPPQVPGRVNRPFRILLWPPLLPLQVSGFLPRQPPKEVF